MVQTNSVCDQFIIWSSSMTLTFNLPEQMFQMALLLVEENTCVTLFLNPYINVGVLSQASLIYVTFKCDLDLQPT